MTDNFSHAARLLKSNRGTLLSIRKRHQHTATYELLSTDKTIPLPANIFTIRQNEDFDSFKRRIQLAVILETIKVEGNHSRAALRLGCNRSTLVRLRYQLQTH